MKLLSQMDVVYYRSALVKVIQGCVPGELHYTFHFYTTDSSFKGDNGVFLRRCLRTLVQLGYMECHPRIVTYLRWSITQKGIEYLANYDKLNPKPL